MRIHQPDEGDVVLLITYTDGLALVHVARASCKIEPHLRRAGQTPLVLPNLSIFCVPNDPKDVVLEEMIDK